MGCQKAIIRKLRRSGFGQVSSSCNDAQPSKILPSLSARNHHLRQMFFSFSLFLPRCSTCITFLITRLYVNQKSSSTAAPCMYENLPEGG